MAQTIKIKRTSGNTKPTNVAAGELFYAYATNGVLGTYGKRLSIGHPDTPGNSPEIIGGSYYTNIIDTAATANTASKLVLRDGSGNFAAGTITAALSGNATTATALATARTIAITGDITYNSGSFDGSANVTSAATLANSGVTAATYGSTTAIPVLAIDAKGRVTSASTASITTSFTLSDGSTDQTIAGGDTLTVAGTANEVEVAVSATDTLTIGLPSTVSGLTTVSATNLTGTLSTAAQPNVTSLGTLTALTVDDITLNGSTISDGGDLTLDVGGDITIDADGGTITFSDGGSSLGTITSSGYSGNAATATTLANARTIGGVSFDGSANINLPGVNATGNQDTSGNAATATILATARTIGGVSFDGSANINLPGVNTAGNQNTSGNATTATTAAVATTVTITDNEATNENNVLIFGAGAAGSGNIGLEADGDLIYNPSTGLLSAPNLTIAGNLTVSGTTTTVDTDNTAIKDNLIVLNSGYTGSGGTETAGIEIERGSATNVILRWNDSTDTWQVTTDGSSYSTLLTAANFSSTYTGDIDGGVF